MEVQVPWNAWHGDTEMTLRFPLDWRVKVVPMRDGPDIGDQAIARAFQDPIGTPTLREIARGRRDAVVVVDDLTRPTPAARLLPHILDDLREAGIPEEQIKIIIALGIGHQPHLRPDNVKKLGQDVVDRIEIMNHVYSRGKYAYLGRSSRGSEIYLNRFFVDADVKIGVGCIMPHASAGFGGGGKVILPGIASIETVEAHHLPAEEGKSGGLGMIEGNKFREEIEEVTRMAGLDFIANVVVNSQRGIAGIFVGDPIVAHRAGVQLARRVCATPNVPEGMDIVVINSYPKDMNLGRQAGNAFNILFSTPKAIVREGGTIIMTCACFEGPGYDKASDRFHRWHDYPLWARTMAGKQVIVFSPNVSAPDVREVFPKGTALFSDWSELIRVLQGRHGRAASVAVFPCATLQLAEDQEHTP